MNEIFDAAVTGLREKFEQLMTSAPLSPLEIPKKGGVYVFAEGPTALYVGRTRNLRNRIKQHTAASRRDAPFAFRIARETTNNHTASYKPKGSRNELLATPEFAIAYADAKARILKMNVRFVIEEDPICQALLEIYIALLLKAPYNDFDTH